MDAIEIAVPLTASSGEGEPERLRRGSPEYAAHQKYLARVIDKVGRLTLANIHPSAADARGPKLEEVYVDLPTEFGLFAEVKDARITDCWIAVDSGNAARLRYEMPDGKGVAEGLRTRLDDLGIEEGAALRSLAARAQDEYRARRAEADARREKGGFSYGDIEDGIHTITSPLTTAYIASIWRRLVVLGDPGTGKSTFVRHLALCLAGEAQEGRTRRADLTRLTGWTQGCLTPIYVELRSFVGSSHFPQDSRDDHPWADHLLRYIEAEILGEAPNAYAPHLESALRSGNAVLILDGLDETPDLTLEGNLATRQQQLRSLSVSLETNFPATRIVVASRPYAYENWRWDDYHVVRIVPFDADRRTALAENLFRAARYNEPERQAEQFNRAMEDQRVAQALADNPLFITLIATLFVRSKTGQNLPTRKGALYRECVELLLQRWTPTKKGMPSLTQFLGSIQPQDLTARLAWLAFEVHSRSGSGQNGVAPEIPSELFGQFVSRIMKRDHAVDLHGLLSYLSDKAGLLISPGHRDDDYVFRFAHQTFQEYLAALHLICERCKTNYVPVREHITLQPDRWRIACLLVGDILRDKDSDDIALDDLWKLVHHLLEGDVPNSAMAKDDPHWWPVWLAASIVEEQTIYEPMPDDRVKRAIRASLVEWLMKLLETAEALPPQERSRCGRALGLLGDKRAGVGIGMHGLPDIVWGAPVLPGAYPVGGDERAFRSLPADTFPLSYSYRLSKYLVTNAQFQAFVDADASGYNDVRYWTSAGWEWKGDRRAPEAREDGFGLSNHPRVNVSWYEALAFCRWLTVCYRSEGLIGKDASIGLPTEIEWEIGCRGSSGRFFSYEGEYDASKCNTYQTGIGQTSAVGLFPSGASPYDVLDMSGNVWEWCLTTYGDGSNDPAGTASRVLRGGSWDFVADGTRAASRYAYNPNDRLDFIGFRVVCLPH